MEFYGKIIYVGAIASGESARGQWERQEFVVETVEQYPKKCVFTVFGGDKINEFALNAGDIVKVEFNIDAREYQGRWYNTIQAWRVTRDGQMEQHNAPQTTSTHQVAASPVAQSDNLPF